MIFAPTSGPVGMQPHGQVCSMVNKETTDLAIGDVVVNSFESGIVFPATTVAEQSSTPFSCVIRADGSPIKRGYIGVVVGLGSFNGKPNTEVLVQFGGVAIAKVQASGAAVALGSLLGPADTAGQLANGGATTPTYPCALALGAVADGSTTNINVLLSNQIWYGADI